MHIHQSTIARFIPLAVALTALTGLVYLSGQQQYRSMLNDPQTQLVRDTARLVTAGIEPEDLAPQGSAIEISESLAPWIAFYDSELVPLAATGLLHGTIPQIPSSVFAMAESAGEETLTWEPEVGVRQALVVKPLGDKGFVVSGRNMEAVDERTHNLAIILFLGWLIALGLTFFAVHYAEGIARRIA